MLSAGYFVPDSRGAKGQLLHKIYTIGLVTLIARLTRMAPIGVFEGGQAPLHSPTSSAYDCRRYKIVHNMLLLRHSVRLVLKQDIAVLAVSCYEENVSLFFHSFV